MTAGPWFVPNVELRDRYVETLIGLLASAGHSNDDLTALMDRIERLLGLSEPAQDIPLPFRADVVWARILNAIGEETSAAPPLQLADPVELTESAPGVASVDEHSPATTDHLTSTNGARRPAATPAPEIRPAPAPRLARALSSPQEVCEPGCGQSFALGSLGAHRSGCAAWLAYRTVHVHDVTDPDWPKPLPDDGEPAREAAFVARRTEAASEKAGKTWAARHPGEAKPLTEQQAEIMAAIRANGGNIEAANRTLGLKGGISHASVYQLRSAGRLPADVAALIEARKADRAGGGGSRVITPEGRERMRENGRRLQARHHAKARGVTA